MCVASLLRSLLYPLPLVEDSRVLILNTLANREYLGYNNPDTT
jgi:hypothetical protein